MAEVEASSLPLRVVVIDDDPLVLAVAKRVLARAGFVVALFADVQQALAEIAGSRPFAVVADLHMPDMDGVELLAEVQKVAPTSHRLLYTGEGHSGELERRLPVGLVHAVVPKAAGVQLLPAALERLRHLEG